MHSRRSFLKRVSAAVCGAMIATFPDFGDKACQFEAREGWGEPSTFGVLTANIIDGTVSTTDMTDDLRQAIDRFDLFTDTPGIQSPTDRDGSPIKNRHIGC